MTILWTLNVIKLIIICLDGIKLIIFILMEYRR